jgi:hypothetical protein
MSFSPPGQTVESPLSPIGSRALSQSQPYSPLVRSRFLSWLTGFYISNWYHVRGLLITMMIGAARTFEMLVNFYQSTWHYNPEDSHLQTHRHENLKSYLKHVKFCKPRSITNFNTLHNASVFYDTCICQNMFNILVILLILPDIRYLIQLWHAGSMVIWEVYLFPLRKESKLKRRQIECWRW